MASTFYQRSSVINSIAGRTDVAAKKAARASLVLEKLQAGDVELTGDLIALNTMVVEDRGLSAEQKAALQAAIQSVARLRLKKEAKQLAAEAAADLADVETAYAGFLKDVADTAAASPSNPALIQHREVAAILLSELASVKTESTAVRDAVASHKV